MKITIVGNAPSLNGSGLGSFIDSSNVVIRFSDFSTAEAHRTDVGSRTDIWCGYMRPHPKMPTFSRVLFPWVGPINMQAKLDAIERECEKYSIPCEVISKHTVDFAYAMLGLERDRNPKPTCGFVGVCYALQHYNYPENHIYICGFDGYTGGYHYHSPGRAVPPNVHRKHCPDKEIRKINEWVEEGILSWADATKD